VDIFLSWSGEKSKAAAIAFRDWLPNLITSVKPWISSEDIDAGKRWSNELQEKLDLIDFGVFFVTRNNQKAPWLTFEAGCLSKSIKAGVVCPLLLDLTPRDIKSNPLSLFQSKQADKDGILSIVSSINKAQKDSIDVTLLKRIYDKWWPELEQKFAELPDDDEKELIENLLELSDEDTDVDGFYDYCCQISKNIRDYMCLHQGSLIEYIFLAGEHHKELKKEFGKEERVLSSIVQKHNELLDHLNESFKEAVIRSFDEIQKMHAGKHLKAPRICLKANYDSGEDKIIVLFREKRVKYISDCNVTENTGFQFIKENGVYYLCQNIPEKAGKGEYYNPRLNNKNVIKYMRKLRSNPSSFINQDDFKDDEWSKCWHSNGQKVAQHYRNCYKSTLIIPLTLWNNKLGSKFLAKFNMKNVDRTIFGYLCLDHINTDYFDDVFDVDTGYIYADILSLYLLVRFIFVNQSKSYRDVVAYLKENSAYNETSLI
jgi:hypothetical protein